MLFWIANSYDTWSTIGERREGGQGSGLHQEAIGASCRVGLGGEAYSGQPAQHPEGRLQHGLQFRKTVVYVV